jgi:hypothetical protein
MMATDTAPFRYPYYHTRYDTPDKLSYRALAEVVIGLRGAIVGLAMGNGRSASRNTVNTIGMERGC